MCETVVWFNSNGAGSGGDIRLLMPKRFLDSIVLGEVNEVESMSLISLVGVEGRMASVDDVLDQE